MTFSDWQEVAYSTPGSGYEWDEFNVKWTGEQFAWSRQSGCSCNSFEYDEDKYRRGTQQELLIAISEWNGGSFGTLLDTARLIEKIHEWKAVNNERA